MKGTLWKMVGAWPWNHNSRLWEMIQQMVLTSIEQEQHTAVKVQCEQTTPWLSTFRGKMIQIRDPCRDGDGGGWPFTTALPAWLSSGWWAAMMKDCQPDNNPVWKIDKNINVDDDDRGENGSRILFEKVVPNYITTSHIGGVNWNLSKMGVLLLACLIQLKLNCIPSYS